MDAKIHVRRLGRLLFEPQGFQRCRRRIGVGHFKHRGDTATGRCGRASLPGFLVWIAWIAKMHVAIDRSRQKKQAVGPHLFTCSWHQVIMTHSNNLFTRNRNAGLDDLIGRHHTGTPDDQVHFFHVVSFHSMAQPPSTGKSTPVIWRDTSLAIKRHALATSSSFVTRFSA